MLQNSGREDPNSDEVSQSIRLFAVAEVLVHSHVCDCVFVRLRVAHIVVARGSHTHAVTAASIITTTVLHP